MGAHVHGFEAKVVGKQRAGWVRPRRWDHGSPEMQESLVHRDRSWLRSRPPPPPIPGLFVTLRLPSAAHQGSSRLTPRLDSQRLISKAQLQGSTGEVVPSGAYISLGRIKPPAMISSPGWLAGLFGSALLLHQVTSWAFF